MTSPIWQKKQQASIDQNIMAYMAGEDVLLDAEIFLYDIEASKAHVSGLVSIGILTESEVTHLQSALDNLALEFARGDFVLDARFEDCHSAIEYYLTQKLGELGKKIHTGRSRNDQVAVATRLYLKSSLLEARNRVKESVKACLVQAEANQEVAMPGYTHLQRAVPSSAGMWFAGFAEAMLDNLMTLDATIQLVDSNPLGTAAGYGVNLPLDREMTTEKLGFSRMQINPIYTQNSRGKFEIAALNALGQVLLDIRRFSWDLSLFTTQEFDFVALPDEMTTGSSIMPNKRNPDLIELMRGSYATLQAAVTELQSLLSLPSGYQRDLQLTKGPMIRGLKAALATIPLFNQVVKQMKLKPDNLDKAMDTPMFATDFAVELTAQGLPFREAYQAVASRFDELENRKPADSLASRVSPGGCANLMLVELKNRLEELE